VSISGLLQTYPSPASLANLGKMHLTLETTTTARQLLKPSTKEQLATNEIGSARSTGTLTCLSETLPERTFRLVGKKLGTCRRAQSSIATRVAVCRTRGSRVTFNSTKQTSTKINIITSILRRNPSCCPLFHLNKAEMQQLCLEMKLILFHQLARMYSQKDINHSFKTPCKLTYWSPIHNQSRRRRIIGTTRRSCCSSSHRSKQASTQRKTRR